MASIFLSYAQGDRARVAPLASALENLGWSIWWDRKIPQNLLSAARDEQREAA